jgi:hypothetical protein
MTTTAAESPVVVELGRKKAKAIKGLRRGEGPLTGEVMQLLEKLRAEGAIEKGATPVVIVVKQKPNYRSLLKKLF